MDTNTNQPNVSPIENSNLSSIQNPVPLPAKVIAIFFYCLTLAFVVLGVLLCMSSSQTTILVRVLDTGFGVMSGIFTILWGVICFFIGFGLWTGKQWGRILAIALGFLYMLLGVVSFFKLGSTNYIAVLIGIIISSYLLLSVDVQSAYDGSIIELFTISFIIAMCVVFLGMEYSIFSSNAVVVNRSGIIRTAPQTIINTPHVYTNAKYHFRLTFPEYYNLTTLNIPGTAGYQFRSYSNLLLLTVSITPTNGQNLNTLIAKNYSTKGETIQRTNSVIDGITVARLEILINNKATQVQYVLIHEGLFFVLFNQSATPTPVFESVVKSLQFTQ